MVGMNSSEWTGVPEDVAAVRTEVEREIAGSTLLTAYAKTAAENADVIAHQWRDGDEWRTLTYREVYQQVRDATLGLMASGLAPGEFAVIWTRNRSEATIADYAVLHARAVPVFIYATVSAEQAAYIAGHCEATIAIVDREFAAAFESVRAGLPNVRKVVVIEDDWTGLLELGSAEAQRFPEKFDEAWRQVTPEDLITLVYTSGTTGLPKGVMITHHNIRYYQVAAERVLPHEEHADEDGRVRNISFLPMAHVTGRAVDNWAPLVYPVTLTYCPDPVRVIEYAIQVHPTGFLGVPRIWEKLHAGLSAALPDSSPEAVRALPEPVKRAILGKVGLDKVHVAASGAAPLDPEIIEFFRALGLSFIEGWGMTELTFAGTSTAPARYRVGRVGAAVPGTELRVAADGELLARGPLLMRGYYKDPELTAQTIDADGWLHTGDIGEIDGDGSLRIIDRKKEIIITAGGKNVSPALVEYELQRHPLIGQACAIGDRRSYLTALLVLDPDTAPAWARARGIEFGTVADLASHPEVLEEVERGVAAANSHLARPEQVRRWVLLPGEWTAQSGELTPSLKRRRRVIVDRYAKEIEALYA
jgi:long-subunit acyl-CoA synthetase (AMP-forming)